MDARNRVVGVVSSTDIIGAQAETRSPEEQRILLEDTRVQDIMTPRPLLKGLVEAASTGPSGSGRGRREGDVLTRPTFNNSLPMKKGFQ